MKKASGCDLPCWNDYVNGVLRVGQCTNEWKVNYLV